MPKIFDCFPFFNELDLLELRLNELADVVDFFVLAEAPVTYRGIPKPLYFLENKERFAKFLRRIVHVIVDDMPAGGTTEPERWMRERFQRQAFVHGLMPIGAISSFFQIWTKYHAPKRSKALPGGEISFQLDIHSRCESFDTSSISSAPNR